MNRRDARASYIETHWGHPGDIPDQRLRCADPADVHFAVLGTLAAVTYETAKGRFALPELWEHEFLNPRPLLCYSPRSKLLLVAGGGYTVTKRGIER